MNRSNWRVERLTKAPLRATDDDDMRSSSTSTTRQRHQRRGSAARSTAEGTMESSLFPDEDDDTDDESPGAYAITRDKRPSTAGLSNLDRQIQEEQEDEWDPTAGPDEFAAGLSNLDQEIVEEQEDEWDPNVDPDEVFMDGEVHVAAAAPNVSNNEHSDDIITNKNCSNSSKRRRIIIAFVVGVVVLIIAATVGIVVGLGRTTTDPEKDQPMLSSNNTTTSHPESHAVFTSDCATSTEVVSAEGRYSSFRSRLEAQFPDIIANVDIPLSTERLALCWLADFDDKAREELRFQRFLLALVYFHFINQQQQSNSKRLVESDVEFGNAWLGDEHECEWEHVDCSVEEAKVTELHLSDIGLHGKIPTFLSHFTNLVSLNLSFNTLTGEIPSDLRNSMPQLLSLYLASNQLSGAIGSVSNLSRLSLLAVNSNWFTGTIPDLSALSNLQFLELGSNDFEGSFPDLSSATNLGALRFSNLLGIDGTIPSELWTLSSLYALNIDSTSISGSIPTEIGLLTNLETLDLPRNRFTGTVPSELGHLTKLESMSLIGIDLSVNKLSGTIPEEVCTMLRSQNLAIRVDKQVSCERCEQCQNTV